MSDRQRTLPFKLSKEEYRLARIKRLLGDEPRITTAAKMFDEQTEREATAKARASL